MSLQLFQNNILGDKDELNKKVEKIKAPAKPREFKNITMLDGVDPKTAQGDAMLILRMLQRRTLKASHAQVVLDSTKRLVQREIDIKTGDLDAVTSARDALISFFVKPRV